MTSAGAITAPLLRAFPLELGGAHAPGGVHAVFRAVKALLRWWGVEAEPEGWRNPLATEPLDRDDLRRPGQVGPEEARMKQKLADVGVLTAWARHTRPPETHRWPLLPEMHYLDRLRGGA